MTTTYTNKISYFELSFLKKNQKLISCLGMVVSAYSPTVVLFCRRLFRCSGRNSDRRNVFEDFSHYNNLRFKIAITSSLLIKIPFKEPFLRFFYETILLNVRYHFKATGALKRVPYCIYYII